MVINKNLVLQKPKVSKRGLNTFFRPEALLFLVLYVFYCVGMAFNSKVEKWANVSKLEKSIPIKIPDIMIISKKMFF